ncbi:hypothetical protein D3C81_424720 [compost metagenome]
MIEQMRQAFAAAVSEVSLLNEAADVVVAQLKEGVNLEVAYKIVDRYWEGRDAAKVKTNLSASFPEDNGQAILNAPFTEKIGMALDFSQSKAFVEMAFPCIIELVEAKFKEINSKDLNDTGALIVYNDFRKEPARFIEYVRDNWFEGRDELDRNEIQSWTQLREEAKCVDNGDYLMLDDYRHEITALQEIVMKMFDLKTEIAQIDLGGLSWYSDRLLCRMKLCMFFANYIEGLVADNTVA